MKYKKFILNIGTLILISFLIFTQSQGEPLFPSMGETKSKPGTHPPLIINSYAIEKGQYGTVLRLYIEADDPDGDMYVIATRVDQVGLGYYPTDWTFIKHQNQHHLLGYLQWNTFSSKVSSLQEWTYLTINVSIFDKAGNESNVVSFPFTFQSGIISKPQPPPPFDQRNIQRLGNITTDLIDINDHHGMEIWPN